METYWLFGKEKVPGEAVSKEGYADSRPGHERTHHDGFFEKGKTVDRVSYWQLLQYQ